MKLSQYVYDLPLNLIAQYPAKNRDESKLMVVHKDTGKIEHKMFKDEWIFIRQKVGAIGNMISNYLHSKR